MAGKYAANTSVPVENTRAEIEKTLNRYGATAFAYGWSQTAAQIEFWLHDRRVRFLLPLPAVDDPEFTTYYRGSVRYERTASIAKAKYEQGVRQRWRALNLAIKAKLEAVEAGISTFDEEFLSFIVTPDGRRISDAIVPQVEAAYERGEIPQLSIGAGA